MNIGAYVKDHPWATGIIVIVGGLIFFMLVGGGGGSTSSDGSLSDAEIAANAQIQAAQIAAQASAAQAGAALQSAQIGAGVQMNSDNLAAQVAMRGLEVNEKLGLANTDADKAVGLATVDAQKAISIANIQGQVDTQRIITSGMVNMNSSNKKAQTSGGIIGAIGGIAGALGSIFSDQRLKENIRLVGEDKHGNNVYEFNYKGSQKMRRGYIAQDIAQHRPDAIIIDNDTGFMRVNPMKLAG